MHGGQRPISPQVLTKLSRPPSLCRQCTPAVFLGLINTCGNRNAPPAQLKAKHINPRMRVTVLPKHSVAFPTLPENFQPWVLRMFNFDPNLYCTTFKPPLVFKFLYGQPFQHCLRSFSLRPGICPVGFYCMLIVKLLPFSYPKFLSISILWIIMHGYTVV